MGACARNMQSDPAEIKPAQCCIKLVFHLTYTMMHGSTKLKSNIVLQSNDRAVPSYIFCFSLQVLQHMDEPQFSKYSPEFGLIPI